MQLLAFLQMQLRKLAKILDFSEGIFCWRLVAKSTGKINAHLKAASENGNKKVLGKFPSTLRLAKTALCHRPLYAYIASRNNSLRAHIASRNITLRAISRFTRYAAYVTLHINLLHTKNIKNSLLFVFRRPNKSSANKHYHRQRNYCI